MLISTNHVHCARGLSGHVTAIDQSGYSYNRTQNYTADKQTDGDQNITPANASTEKDKNSSGDEIANVNFFTTSHM